MKVYFAVLFLIFSTGAAQAADGQGTFNSSCVECHGAGLSGAPKIGDKVAWAPRIRQGKNTLYAHALNGFKWMPPKGGFDYLSDDDVKAAVDYMVKRAR